MLRSITISTQTTNFTEQKKITLEVKLPGVSIRSEFSSYSTYFTSNCLYDKYKRADLDIHPLVQLSVPRDQKHVIKKLITWYTLVSFLRTHLKTKIYSCFEKGCRKKAHATRDNPER